MLNSDRPNNTDFPQAIAPSPRPPNRAIAPSPRPPNSAIALNLIHSADISQTRSDITPASTET
jgi:hypothetical protein